MAEQTQLEYDCAECASYIMNRLYDMDKHHPVTNTGLEGDLAMWIHDHFKDIE